VEIILLVLTCMPDISYIS